MLHMRQETRRHCKKFLWTRETGQGRVGDIILVRWRCVDLGRGEDTKQDKCLLLQMAERDHHRGSCLPDKTLGICLKLPNLFVSNWQIYLYKINKYICYKLRNIFVSNAKMYLSQIIKYISVNCKWQRETTTEEAACPIKHWVFVSNCQNYLYQVYKYICLPDKTSSICIKLTNIFV